MPVFSCLEGVSGNGKIVNYVTTALKMFVLRLYGVIVSYCSEKGGV